MSTMNRDAFQEALLAIMEKKTHWSNEAFANGRVAREKMQVHFEQEYAVFVRDFPILVGRASVQCPIASVRRDLAENIYEEETGGILAGKPHPVLFLEIPRGFGCDMKRFESIALLPGSRRYRDILDHYTENQGWESAAAVTTLFIEGTSWERGELDRNAPRRPMPPLDKHPLHVHYGLPLEFLELPRIHRGVEGGHRQAAWRAVLDHVDESARPRVLDAMRDALAGWLAYKDSVAEAVGLRR
jgi:pyrroloquinoline-quinone synthase